MLVKTTARVISSNTILFSRIVTHDIATIDDLRYTIQSAGLNCSILRSETDVLIASRGDLELEFREYTPRYVIRSDEGMYFSGITGSGYAYPPNDSTVIHWSESNEHSFIGKSVLESVQERFSIPGTIYELSELPE